MTTSRRQPKGQNHRNRQRSSGFESSLTVECPCLWPWVGVECPCEAARGSDPTALALAGPAWLAEKPESSESCKRHRGRGHGDRHHHHCGPCQYGRYCHQHHKQSPTAGKEAIHVLKCTLGRRAIPAC
jgi:hypothetical protein